MTAAEVVVVGATAAGVCAAVAAAEHGAQVVLLAEGRHLGGMVSGGLGYTDVGDVRVLGGHAARFRRDVAAHYGVPVGRYAGPEPHVAEGIMRRWLEEAGVEVVLDAPVDGVERDGTRVTAVRTASGERVGAGVVVDASYEGDVLALAGVTTRVGREDRALHGERFAGRREIAPGRHSMPWGVSPFRDDASGEREGALIAQLAPGPMAEVGAGDGNVMSYGYRLCLTSGPDRIPFTEPDGYDPAYWELGRRYLAAGGADEPAGRWLGLEPNLPGGKCDANSLGPVSLSVLDGSARGWAEGSREQRADIAAHHARHALSFLWFLSSDPAVPRGIRDELARWGFAPDEFADTGHLPHQLYVREARRMVGEFVLTEHELRAGEVPGDTIALGSYHLDIREVQRSFITAWEHPDPRSHVVNEGYLSVRVPAYGIPYRALLPRAEEATNVLAAVCVSASHVAFSSVRMEPQYQMLGQAAGTAAALAVRGAGEVHAVDVGVLREALAGDGAVLRVV
ncbi:FAD-dependent oxidoreductase [Protaetiibacter sp. SSC-01]|uniref:FAD-dependent oxidoreductase n=1 Tax=Protaetiibacter sp. SSC-01 TaxID=2759943 RepID=UPI0016571B1C|nr:FAD-dependent oxidoreductase [Protaetiibacter sp. SSC-01]QNO37721.1 FAD-dependent oxidoreductase [Protaetiibacter sp. SSC-01]